MTGTYSFKSGFYGLTDMPAMFQNAMVYTLINLENTFRFSDDILIVSKGSAEENKKYVFDCLHQLNEENFRHQINQVPLCKIKLDWLGNHIS